MGFLRFFQSFFLGKNVVFAVLGVSKGFLRFFSRIFLRFFGELTYYFSDLFNVCFFSVDSLA